MERQPARVLEPADVRRLLRLVEHHRHSHRNRVIVLLSFKAGLRACEISGIDWTMVLTSTGRIARLLTIPPRIAKRGSGRYIPLHPEIRQALQVLHDADGYPDHGPVIRSERGDRMTARSIVNWFAASYHDLGLIGCSSHSGRRTFITRSARLLARTGGSLRDIQELAGHKALTTTERYIVGDRAAQHRLIRLI
jgi:integrase